MAGLPWSFALVLMQVSPDHDWMILAPCVLLNLALAALFAARRPKKSKWYPN